MYEGKTNFLFKFYRNINKFRFCFMYFFKMFIQIGTLQDRRDAEEEGCWKRRIQDRRKKERRGSEGDQAMKSKSF